MQSANARHVKVFIDKGSLNQAQDIAVNTITPIANPSRREGQSWPSKCATICLTDAKYKSDKGNPRRATYTGLFFAHSNLN